MCVSKGIYSPSKRVYQFNEEKTAQMCLEPKSNTNEEMTKIVSAADHTQFMKTSVKVTFASLYISITLAPDTGLCRLPSMAEAALLRAM